MALNEKERWIHYMSLLSIFGIIERIPKDIIMTLAMKIARERCRKLTQKDFNKILSEIHEEQQAGKVVMDEILDRLLTKDDMSIINKERGERFVKKPFDIFFFDRDDRDELV